MIEIDYNFGRYEKLITSEIIENIFLVSKKTLEFENIIGNFEISISFVDNEQIKELNSNFRNKYAVTDVLSFPMIDDFDDIIETDIPNLLGDIVISFPKAEEQAKEYNHSLLREICFLVCHSMLHLLGYDHMEEDDRVVMEEKQKYILDSLGIRRN